MSVLTGPGSRAGQPSGRLLILGQPVQPALDVRPVGVHQRGEGRTVSRLGAPDPELFLLVAHGGLAAVVEGNATPSGVLAPNSNNLRTSAARAGREKWG